MHRRDLFKWSALGAGAVGLPWLMTKSLGSPQPSAPPRSTVADKQLSPLKITDIKTILTAPAKIRLVVVKVVDQRAGSVRTRLRHVHAAARASSKRPWTNTSKPFLIGKDPLQIEDIWQSSFVSSYWRNGPVLGNAISGVDMALWDILGKRAGVPVYQLFGGKCRKAVDTYRHASGDNLPGSREERPPLHGAGLPPRPRPGRRSRIFDLRQRPARQGEPVPSTTARRPGSRSYYARTVPKLFEHLRKQVGDEVELLHDMHERVPPILAMQLAKDLEPYRLFFLEDPLSPEDVGYFAHLRQADDDADRHGRAVQQSQRMAAADDRPADRLHPHPHLAGGRPVDGAQDRGSVRVLRRPHRLARPRRRLAGRPCRQRASRPGDPNFGIQEAREFTQAEQDVFPGCPTLKDGYYWANDKPGLGIDLDEKLAAKFPINDDPPFDMQWGNLRRRDGTVVKP